MRFGIHVGYYLNTTNLPGMAFYTVQVALLIFDVTVHFNRHFHHPDSFYETFDKDSGKIGDLRIEDPEHAKEMAPYMREGRFEYSVMARLPFPWKYRSLTVNTTWRVDL